MVVKPRQTGIGYSSTITKDSTKKPKIRGSSRTVKFNKPNCRKIKKPKIEMNNMALLAALSVFCVPELFTRRITCLTNYLKSKFSDNNNLIDLLIKDKEKPFISEGNYFNHSYKKPRPVKWNPLTDAWVKAIISKIRTGIYSAKEIFNTNTLVVYRMFHPPKRVKKIQAY